jgi:nucleoside-diphosphate-sugar epimerase
MPTRLAELAAYGAEVMRLDLAGPDGAARAVCGMEGVVHAAALTTDWGSAEQFRRMNYELTTALVEAAREEGCRVFVYIGSVAVHGFGPHVDSTEDGPYYPSINPYQTTKKAAEEYVLGCNAPTFRTTCLRPGNAYGPYDTTLLYPMLDAMRKGVKLTLGGGRSLTCPVYVEDLAEAVALALSCEQSAGEVINVTGGERVSWGEFLGYAAELLGARPWIGLPVPLARAVAVALSGLYTLLGIRSPPPLTRYRVEQVTHDYHFSIAKARALLGYEPKVGWREGLRRAVRAYQEDVWPGSRGLRGGPSADSHSRVARSGLS